VPSAISRSRYSNNLYEFYHVVDNSKMPSILRRLANTSACIALVVMGSNVAAQPDESQRPLAKMFCPKQVVPEMPWQASKTGTGGTVVAQARIRYGTVTEVYILSGPELFHGTVANALSHYQCAMLPEEVMAMQTFIFKMAGEPDTPNNVEPPSFVSSVPDSTSIQRSNDLAHIRVLNTFPPVEVQRRTFRSAARTLEFDCKRRRYRIVSSVLHDQSEGPGGPLVRLGESPGERRFLALACDTPTIDTRRGTGTSTTIKLGGHAVPASLLDRRYEQLSAEEQLSVKAQYESVADGDEPPFPGVGLRSIHEAVSEAERSFGSQGALVLHVKVDAGGHATAVDVIKSPDSNMTTFAARTMMLVKFKPAICRGQPCPMAFPLEIELKSEIAPSQPKLNDDELATKKAVFLRPVRDQS